MPRRRVAAASREGASPLTAKALASFAFGTVDVGIGRRIDDGVPTSLGDDAFECLVIGEIKRAFVRRNDLDVIGPTQRLEFGADLTAAAEKEKPHRLHAYG